MQFWPNSGKGLGFVTVQNPVCLLDCIYQLYTISFWLFNLKHSHLLELFAQTGIRFYLACLKHQVNWELSDYCLHLLQTLLHDRAEEFQVGEQVWSHKPGSQQRSWHPYGRAPILRMSNKMSGLNVLKILPIILSRILRITLLILISSQEYLSILLKYIDFSGSWNRSYGDTSYVYISLFLSLSRWNKPLYSIDYFPGGLIIQNLCLYPSYYSRMILMKLVAYYSKMMHMPAH